MIITQHCSDIRVFWIYSVCYTLQPAEFQREVMCVVCLFVGLVCFFLSYSFLKFNGTPLFSISIKPGLIAKQGKPASLPLGSWGRTDSGCRCPHMHRGRSPFAARRSGLPSCLMLAGLPLLLPWAGKELQAELPDKLNVATCKDVFEKVKIKGNTPLSRKAKHRGWASTGDLQWQRRELRHRSLQGVLLHQWSFFFCLFWTYPWLFFPSHYV